MELEHGRELSVDEADVSRWELSLSRRPALITQLAVERGWRYGVMRFLALGLDSGGWVTVPIRNADGELRGVLRYRPLHGYGPKLLAVRGSRLGLVPHPTRERSSHVLLVEGPADMIAARSHGLPPIAIPGAHAWRADWSKLLAGRTVSVVMDCDQPGRDAAARITSDLDGGSKVAIEDLDPSRDDGYDLTDALLEYAHTSVEPPSLARLHARPTPLRPTADRGLER